MSFTMRSNRYSSSVALSLSLLVGACSIFESLGFSSLTTIIFNGLKPTSSARNTLPTLSIFGSGGSNKKSFIPDLPNNPFEIFGGDRSLLEEDNSGLPTEFEPTEGGFIFQAKRLVASDLGLLDPTILDDTQFRWIDANNPTAVAFAKAEYVAAGRFFNIRGAFPDIDYRAHDFRYVGDYTVRYTQRVQGTMRGELRLRDGVTVPPSGLKMKCPPEAISITFDPNTGKVVKICSGFVLDRLVGNTAGTAGAVAASIIGGRPAVSDWDLYPPATVLSRIFARPAKRLDDAESFLAPFPEQVMIQLAKGVLSSNLGADDPSLLSDKEFTFMTPTVGPIRKDEFLEKFAAAEFEGVEDPQFSAFRVDPYDPVRVWVDLQPIGPGYEGPPQAMSLAFDDDGFCTRITSWAVLDPSIGNAGGLGGPEGYKYATGKASSSFVSRPLPSLIGRIRKSVLSPITGISVDEYSAVSSPKTTFKPPQPPKELPQLPKAVPTPPKVIPPISVNKPELPSVDLDEIAAKAAAEREAAAEAVLKRLEAIKDFGASIRIIPSIPIIPPPVTSEAASKPAEDKKKAAAAAKGAELAKKKQEATALKKKQEAEAAKTREQFEKEAEALRKKQQAAQEQKEKQQALAAQKAAAEESRLQQQLEKKRAQEENRARLEVKKATEASAEAKRRQQIEAQKAAVAADEARRKKIIEAERAAEEARRKREADTLKKQQETERERKAKERLAAVKSSVASPADQKEREEAAMSTLLKAASRATISLFGMGGRPKDEDDLVVTRAPTLNIKATSPPKKSAPAGVPSLAKWRKNADKSITGLVKNSKGFTDGSRITTSPIASGIVAPGEVVRTGSGSRYFLE